MNVTTEAREQAADLITRAFQILVATEQAQRPESPDELEELMYCLTMALNRLEDTPGGKEARLRMFQRAEGDFLRRGTPGAHSINVVMRGGDWVTLGCSCGYSPPPGVDADDAMAYHLATVLSGVDLEQWVRFRKVIT